MSVTQVFTEPLITAGISAVVLPMVLKGKGSLNVGGMAIPTWALGAGLGWASSQIAEIVDAYILPQVENSYKVRHFQSMAFDAAAGGVSFAVIPKILNQDVSSSDMGQLFLAGSASKLASSWVYDNFFHIQKSD